ncbi:MAG: hypothetical protein L3J39_09505 [Verrucomicrobiales bacterium]|nr:hypothetical protein [Verrucomicrobiales bacterium]
MKHTSLRHLITLAAVLALPICSSLTAQEKDYHLFTDKKAQSIEAALVSVSRDLSTAHIQRNDGKKFDLPILNLSLDDQMFIKDWLQANPIKSNYSVAAKFVKKNISSDKHKVSSARRLLSKKIAFEIELENKGKDELSGATLEYYLLVAHAIHAYPEPDPETGNPIWTVNDSPQGNRIKKRKLLKFKNPVSYVHDKVNVEKLAFNFSTTLTSKEVELREIILDGGKTLAADKVAGIIARLTDAAGQEIAIFRSAETPIQSIPWQRITQMPPGDPSGVRTTTPVNEQP